MKLTDAFHELRPPVPSTEGWGRAARRRVARRRAAVGGVVGVGILALVVPLVLNLNGSPIGYASPAPASSATSRTEEPPVVMEEELPDCGLSAQSGEPMLDDVLPTGWACSLDGGEVSSIELSPELAREVLDGVQTERVDSGLQPGATGSEFIVLAASEGEPLRLYLGSAGAVRFYHGGSGGIASWEPSPELSRRMWNAVGGSCVETPAFDAAAVTVDVYSAGADAAVVEFVAERLRSQGFTVRDTGLTTQASLPGLYFRYEPGNETSVQVLGAVLGSGGGELSRTDEVIDVVITADYEPKVETQQDLGDVAPGPGLYRERHGINVVRRITGGGAMFMEPGNCVTYSLVVPASLVEGLSFERSYEFLDQWVMGALKELGVNARYVPLNDIASDKGKIAGAAQRRVAGGVVVHHVTMAYDIDADKMLEVLRIGREKMSDKGTKSANKRVDPLRSQTQMARDDIIAAFLAHFEQQYSTQHRTYTESELARAKELVETKFSSEEWTKRIP